MLIVSIPGLADLRLGHLLIDVNGTLTNRGTVIGHLAGRIARLSDHLDVRLVSADTFGTLDSVAELLQVGAVRARTGEEKLRVLDELGGDRCAVVGNGANDALVLEAAALGIAVIGPEGAAGAALRAADVVCASAADALDVLLDARALSATLRP
jgi:soluble P-type ATPase